MAIELETEITELRREVLSMGGLVEQQLQRALRSMHEADLGKLIWYEKIRCSCPRMLTCVRVCPCELSMLKI